MIETPAHTYRYLEHMVHHRNLKSVLTHGLLSRNAALEEKLISKDISMPEVQDIRKERVVPVDGRNMSLHDFVPFYFNSRNPMMYVRHEIQHELVILLISADIIAKKTNDGRIVIFTDGNAANRATGFYSSIDDLSKLDAKIIFGQSWNHEDPYKKKENKRKRCAEVLIYPSVGVNEILRIICPNDNMLKYVREKLQDDRLVVTCRHIQTVAEVGYFF